jgi:hypothetical protein
MGNFLDFSNFLCYILNSTNFKAFFSAGVLSSIATILIPFAAEFHLFAVLFLRFIQVGFFWRFLVGKFGTFESEWQNQEF